MNRFAIRYILCVIIFFSLSKDTLRAQSENISSLKKIDVYTFSYEEKVYKRLKKFHTDINRTFLKFQKKIQQKNRFLLRKIANSTDIACCPDILLNALVSNNKIVDNTKSPAYARTIYFPYLDTLETSLSFLNEMKKEELKCKNVSLIDNLELVTSVKTKLANFEKVTTLISAQKESLGRFGDKYSKHARKYIQSLSKEYYYFSRHITRLREILSDLSKIEDQMITLLRKMPAYQAFMKQHSAIVSLFNIPEIDHGSLNGLQTRSMLKNLLLEKTTFSSVDGAALIANQLHSAKSKIAEFKKDIAGLNTVDELPGFNPKQIKSKTFLERIELGSSIKFSNNNYLLPSRCELLVMGGYKITEKMSLGFGFIYWLSLENRTGKIAFSHLGLGLHSYCKIHLSTNIFMSSGLEQNYFSSFKTAENTDYHGGWKTSALMGIGKKIDLGKSFLKRKWGNERSKNSTVALLYDFLYKKNQPQTESVKLRFGFTF